MFIEMDLVGPMVFSVRSRNLRGYFTDTIFPHGSLLPNPAISTRDVSPGWLSLFILAHCFVLGISYTTCPCILPSVSSNLSPTLLLSIFLQNIYHCSPASRGPLELPLGHHDKSQLLNLEALPDLLYEPPTGSPFSVHTPAHATPNLLLQQPPFPFSTWT